MKRKGTIEWWVIEEGFGRTYIQSRHKSYEAAVENSRNLDERIVKVEWL